MKTNDIILKKFFEKERWEYAIAKGIGKDIKKEKLRRLCSPHTRLAIYNAMVRGEYEIFPPHTAKIPKDVKGEYRTVYVNEAIDRIILSIANDLLFELCADMIHKRCTSYQHGIGCGMVVQDISRRIAEANGAEIGFKADLSKYFDSVPRNFIHAEFDKVEERYGYSTLIDVLRKYYDCDIFFDEDKQLQSSFQSLKQGCSVASFLADCILYELDEKMSKLDGYYVRYSDDIVFVGKDYKLAMLTLQEELAKRDMKLNPKKVEYLSSDTWFKFLGFSIKGEKISISSTRLKKFQREIEQCTIARKDNTLKKATNAVYRYLYKGNGEFSWATQILPVVNCKRDIDELNKFVMDALRAVATKKNDIGGLGYVRTKADGCIQRGKGRNVSANRKKIPHLEYITIGCLQNAIKTQKAVYEAIVRTM